MRNFLNSLLRRRMACSTISATRCHSVTIVWVCLVRFAAITLCTAFQWAFLQYVPSVICNASSEGKKHFSSLASNSVKLNYKYWRWSFCLLLQPKNQTAILLVEKPILSMSTESRASHIKHL